MTLRLDKPLIFSWNPSCMYCGDPPKGGVTLNKNLIEFATMNSWSFQAAVNNVIHELGHVFSLVHGKTPEASVPNEYNYYGEKYNLIGPGGFANPNYLWVQHNGDTGQERFADMFLGWCYQKFDGSDLGDARKDFMNRYMPGWINWSGK
jgi:hypothetical protein